MKFINHRGIFLTNKERGQLQRKQALEHYYRDPNICENCGKVIEIKEHQKIAQIRQNKFCGHSCAAKSNNINVNRWKNKATPRITTDTFGFCDACGEIVNYSRIKDDSRKNGYWIKRFCDNCREEQRHLKRCDTLNFDTYSDKINNGLTLGALKTMTEKHGYFGFRAKINAHARRVIKEYFRLLKCQVCGFNIQVHICHRKDVSSFDPETEIKVINDNSNLIVLCPNHHIMFDKGLINIGE